MKKLCKYFFSIALILFLSACTHFGAHTLPPDRIRYNKSIINSDLQQTLLNLVRLRFGDSPNFLSVSSVVSQFSVGGSVASDPSRTVSPGTYSNTINLSLSSNYSESPTITYTPMQGEEFITRLCTPVDLKIVRVFLRDGWGIGRVFRTFFQTFGDMENALEASRPASHRIPQYKAFEALTCVLRDLQIYRDISFDNDNDLAFYRIRFKVKSFKHLSSNQRSVLAKLGITPQNPTFWVTTTETDLPHHFFAETRTMLAIYSFLSKGVEVPKGQEHFGKTPRFPNGNYFDWSLVVGGLIDIKSSKSPPHNAYISVYYRKHYFYIRDDDEDAKEGMNLLMLLNGIFQGNIQSVLPVFTVS
jgi:hypothetical protein